MNSPLLESLEREEFARRIGLPPLPPDGEEPPQPAPRGLAEAIRRELRRNPVMTWQELRKQMEPLLGMAGYEAVARQQLRQMADELVSCGELLSLRADHQSAYAAAAPRWIQLTGRQGVLLGVSDVEGVCWEWTHPRQYLRRFDAGSEIHQRILERQGIARVPLENWLGPPGWQQFCPQGETLPDLWHDYQRQVTEQQVTFPLSDSAIRVLAGSPDQFYGSHLLNSGRWQSLRNAGSGTYLGVQPGYHDKHWRPILVAVTGETAQSLMLNGGPEENSHWELFNWLLLARGEASGQREIIQVDPAQQRLHIFCPLPAQIHRLLRVLGESESLWQYSLAELPACRTRLEDHISSIQFLSQPG